MSLEPYYQDEQATIYCGDCREILPTLGRFDLLLTDPPYGIEWNTNYSRFTNSMTSAPRKDHPEICNDQTTEMMKFALQYDAQKIVWGAHLSPWLISDRGSWLVWDKRFENGVAMLADAELAYWSKGTGVYIHKHTWQGMIGDKSGTPRKRTHPNEKPVGLMRWCVSLEPDAERVIDICCGTGSAVVAAKLEGRKAVGIEINQKYCDIAIQRLRQKVLF